jgi:prepilin-type N-terminal cleavage/methylation domain-containing protein
MAIFKPVRRRAFTVIELIVTMSILATLITLAALDFSQVRLQARNTTRKNDGTALVAAMQALQSVEGNLFVTYKGAACNIQSGQTKYNHGNATGPGCTGASGLAYGLMDTATAITSGDHGHSTPYVYTGHSIISALAGSYLRSEVRDPLTTDPNDPSQRHPVLLRCCASTGFQNIGRSGQSFSVWEQLEPVNGVVPLSAADRANTTHGCGGSSVTPDGYPNYQMDYAGNEGAADYNFGLPGGVLPKTIQASLQGPSTCSV